jgi:glycosyltransferase involved in cell wall biosynthesis
MNVHIHPVNLAHASRILKCLESAARSGCFRGRTFIGAGPNGHHELQDSLGAVGVRLFPRASAPGSSFLSKVLATLAWSRKVNSYARSLPATCLNVHGLSTLALGVSLKRHHGCKLIYDTHELESKAFAVRGIRRVYSERLERALIHNCDAVVCVSDGIADWYASRYGIKRPLVVRNVPDRRSQVASKTVEDLRAHYGMAAGAMLFMYQGRLSAGRQIEQFIEVFARLSPNHHLVFMGAGELEDAVRAAAANHPNIHFHPAVPPNEVLAYSVQADVGLIGVSNECLSYYLSLPNKLFESLAAGIPVIVPDFPEMSRLVHQYHCGWTWTEGNGALKTLIESISFPEVKAASRAAATAIKEFSWEREEQRLVGLYRALLSERTRREPSAFGFGERRTAPRF